MKSTRPRADPPLPPPILTSDPGSFAEYTLRVRIPRILDQVIERNLFPPDIRGALESLRREVTGGTICGLREHARDKKRWDILSRPYTGRSWRDVPWYWAEAFFYRRLLEATRFFQPGACQGYDPFDAQKRQELDPQAGPGYIERTIGTLPVDPQRRFETLVYTSLWGNRLDLSHAVASAWGPAGQVADERANLVIDDTGRLWEFLRGRRRRRVAIVADNAGTELLSDLMTADFLLTDGLAAEVALHVKAHPFFVSDATMADVEAAVDALGGGGGHARELGNRIRRHLEGGRLRLRTHWFYTSSLCYFRLPRDLARELAGTDLVLLKGDANYRRLLGDAHWPPTASFAGATAYFPAPLAVLRTFKSELVVGLDPGVADRLRAEDPEWLVNGRRGIVQARLSRPEPTDGPDPYLRPRAGAG